MVDVYQQWAGPCKSVEGNFKRIKNETGDQSLKFALVIIISHFLPHIHYLWLSWHLIPVTLLSSIVITPIKKMICSFTFFALLFILVIDVYQIYGGPCKALEAKFRAIKNTLGDPLLYFIVVSSCKHRCFPSFAWKINDINHILTLTTNIFIRNEKPKLIIRISLG